MRVIEDTRSTLRINPDFKGPGTPLFIKEGANRRVYEYDHVNPYFGTKTTHRIVYECNDPKGWERVA